MNKELLSVLMDGEASNFEVRRSVQLLSDDASARDQLDHYQMVRAVLRNELPPMDVRGFADQIKDKIEAEVDIKQPATAGRSMTGYAIAATVTAAAVFGLWQAQTQVAPVPAPTIASVPQVAPQTERLETLASLETPVRSASTARPELDSARMSSYLVNHSESSPPAVIPFVRLVGYNSQ